MLLHADGLYKAFDNVNVLKNVSFGINEGEVVSLIGQSGAGKTTVLRCISGLEKCDKGDISIDGKYLCRNQNGSMNYASRKEMYEIRKSLGMVFQNYHLFPHLTVLQNVSLALTEVYGLDKQQASETAVSFLERLGLGDKVANKPYELSGGQKQRVAIARSCVTNPKLLCFDEPTAALDSALVGEIIGIIRGLAEDGMGVLIISHDEKFVRDVSDRILLMQHGQIQQEMTSGQYAKTIRN